MHGDNLRRTQLLDGESGEPLTHVDGSLKRLALDDTSKETTSESIASTVAVVDVVLVDGVDGELLDALLALDGDESGLGALSDNSNALSLAVLLGEVGEVRDNVLRLLGGKVVGLSVGGSLGLVTDDVVPVGSRSINNVLEELRNERGRERQDEGLVVLSSLLSELHDGRRADGEVVAADVVDVGVLDEAPDLGALQVLQVVVVGSAELSAQRAVGAGDDDTAAASLLLGVDAVLDAEAGSLDGIAQDGRVLVVTDTTEVDNAVLGEDVLGTTGGVLGSTTSNELGVVVVEQVLVQRAVLVLSEDGVVGLQGVLVEKLLVADSLNV